MKKTGGFQFLLGVLIGAVFFGGMTAYAAGIMANPTGSKVLVNGQEIKVEAYNIHDNNFFMLRDIAAAVDFSVVWDGQGNRVLIDTSRGYDPSEQYASEETAMPADSDEAPDMTVDEMKAEIIRLTNVERVGNGLPELKVLPELMDCAQAKAQDFMDNSYYGHNSPVYGTPLQMVLSFGINATGCSENAAPGRDTPTGVMAEWMESSSHRGNILNVKRTHIGVGIIPTADGASYMWVAQMITLK